MPLWDYSDWKYNNDRDLFYNSQHLNATGAALFSEDLASRLKNYFSNGDGSGNYIEPSGVGVYPNGNEN